MEIDSIKEKVREITLRLKDEDIIAVGLFGSLVRGNYSKTSDIDIFVITQKELPLKQQDELYYAFSELIPKFGRDITVLVYDIETLKKIPSWQTLNMVKDGCFVYDRAEVEKVFNTILQEAKEHGIVYDSREKVFRLKEPKRLFFSLSEK